MCPSKNSYRTPTIPERTGNVHFRSASDDWATPQWLFDLLDAEFGFTLDACASPENAKVPDNYYTREDDGLAKDWGRNVVFCNPPYGRQIGKWVGKAFWSAAKGATVVMLIPARTDTRCWNDFVTLADEVRLIDGRLKFGHANNHAPFPSAVVVFEVGAFVGGPPKLSTVDARGR